VWAVGIISGNPEYIAATIELSILLRRAEIEIDD
jgi:hypothetical protein